MAQQFEFLKCKLTPIELKELGEQLAKTNQLIYEMRNAKKASNAQMNASIQTTEANAANLSKRITQGFEERQVEVITLFDTPEIGRKTVVRVDTGETIRTEAMTPEEKQQSLDFGKAN